MNLKAIVLKPSQGSEGGLQVALTKVLGLVPSA